MKETTFRSGKEYMSKLKTIIVITFILVSMSAYALMSPTIQKRGRWVSLSSSLVVDAIIDDKAEKVCLPKLVWKEEVDKVQLEKIIKEGLVSQEAVFNLYHDGLGRPKKENGYYYASDVFLKDLDMTYTGYLRKNGFKVHPFFKICNDTGGVMSAIKEIEINRKSDIVTRLKHYLTVASREELEKQKKTELEM